MAEFTKVNGAGFDHGVQYSFGQLESFEFDALVDLTSKDGLGGAIDLIVQEFSPLMYISSGTAGKIFMIMDGHHVTAASLQVRLQAMGTVDGVNLASATVTQTDLDSFDNT